MSWCWSRSNPTAIRGTGSLNRVSSRSGTPDPTPSRFPGEVRLNRRRFIGLTAAGGVAAALAFGIADAESGNDAKATAKPPAHPADKGKTSTHESVAVVDGLTLPTSPFIIAENARPGHPWWVDTPQVDQGIEGFASQVSASIGDTVTLFVSTRAARYHVEAYRMGFYQGFGARQVWVSEERPGVRQPPPDLIAPTNTIECNWSPSLNITIDPSWPPGAYLLKLVGSTDEQQYVPLCIRDDESRAAIVIQHSVTTWQAYNRWGGYSLYYGNPDGQLSFFHAPSSESTYEDRARVVSFDRPYDYDWASGAADLVGNEFPVIYQAEQLGLDVTYWTDVDFHANPQLLDNHKALLSLGHDEYWSAPMRDGAQRSLESGVNLAFLGANACYRQIRFESSPLGENRREVCYKSAEEDPIVSEDPALTTVNWEDAPVSRPESQLIGSMYQDIDAQANMVVNDPTHWLFEGLGFVDGQVVPSLVEGEFDRYVPDGAGPTNVDVVAHSIVPNRGGNYSDVTWYTVDGGGGVFATGNASWIGHLSNSTLIPGNVVPDAIPGVTEPLLRIMVNLYSVIGMGPASRTRPSQGTWRSVYTPGSASSAAPDTVNAA